MSVLQHAEIPAQSVPDGRWWSPLAAPEAAEILKQLGATEIVDVSGSNSWALTIGDDAFAPVVTFEPSEAQRGSFVRVQRSDHGFRRDFARVVQIGLTVFAGWLFCCAALLTTGDTFIRACAAIVLGWAVFMGVFAAARVLVTLIVDEEAAVSAACARVRLALFARRG